MIVLAVGQLFTRLSTELESLKDLASEVERVICDAMEEGRIGLAGMEKVQELDPLIQHLQALSDFSAALADAGESSMIDISAALAGIRLGALKARLAGGDAFEPIEPGAEFF